MSMSSWMMMRSLSRDSSVADKKLAPGTYRRVMAYSRRYRASIIAFVLLVMVDAVLVVAVPLLLRQIVDQGVIPGDSGVVVRLALIVAGIALAEAVLNVVQRWFSSRIGEGLILDLRTQVFGHVLEQPIAFFTRTQTGALVSRLNSDVIGAQQAFTSVLSNLVSNIVSVTLVVATMFVLSWQLTVGALLLVPVFLFPAKYVGRRLAGLAHRQMSLNADLGSRMTERFNVAGALLVKLFGSPERERGGYPNGASSTRYRHQHRLNRSFMAALTLVAALATAMVYGFGGLMAVRGSLTLSTLLAHGPVTRLYGPLTVECSGRRDDGTDLVRADSSKCSISSRWSPSVGRRACRPYSTS